MESDPHITNSQREYERQQVRDALLKPSTPRNPKIVQGREREIQLSEREGRLERYLVARAISGDSMPIKQNAAVEAPARIPKWSKSDQDFWLDYFQSASDAVINAIMGQDENSTLMKIAGDSGALKEQLKDGVRMAAELADTAVEEALYRGWVQQSVRKAERRKRAR